MESQNPLEKAQPQICPGDIAKTKEPQMPSHRTRGRASACPAYSVYFQKSCI